MARFPSLIHRSGQAIATGGAADVVVAAYTVPAASILRISDIMVSAPVVATVIRFYVYEAGVAANVDELLLPAAGVTSRSNFTPLEFAAGSVVSITCAAANLEVVTASWEGNLIQ